MTWHKARTSFSRAAGLALACLAAVRPAEGFENTAQQRASFPTPHNPLNYPHLLSHTLSTHSPSPPPLLLRTYVYVYRLCERSKQAQPLSVLRPLSFTASNRPLPPPVMPAEELAQGLVFSFSSIMSHRAAIFHGFLYAFIAVVCYGSSSTRARAGDDHAAGPLASAMQPTGVVAGQVSFHH